MLDKFQAIFDRYKNLEEQLSDPEAVQDLARFKKTNKEYKDLQPIVEAFQQYQEALSNLDLARKTLREDDVEMQELAREEIEILEPTVS